MKKLALELSMKLSTKKSCSTNLLNSILSLDYQKNPYIIYFKMLSAVVEDVRTVFEMLGDASICIPTFSESLFLEQTGV